MEDEGRTRSGSSRFHCFNPSGCIEEKSKAQNIMSWVDAWLHRWTLKEKEKNKLNKNTLGAAEKFYSLLWLHTVLKQPNLQFLFIYVSSGPVRSDLRIAYFYQQWLRSLCLPHRNSDAAVAAGFRRRNEDGCLTKWWNVALKPVNNPRWKERQESSCLRGIPPAFRLSDKRRQTHFSLKKTK